MANWRVYSNSDNGNYLAHKSRYGSFVTINGRSNNSSEYNHNYYIANKKNKQGGSSSSGSDLSEMSIKELLSYSKQKQAESSAAYDEMSDAYDRMLEAGVLETKQMSRGEPVTDSRGYFGSQKRAIEEYNASCNSYKTVYEENMAAQREVKRRGSNARDAVNSFRR